MTFQSLRKHQITRPNIYLWNNARLRWLIATVLTLGMGPFAIADDPFISADPFSSRPGASAQTWEELKGRSAEKRWESISRESKRELKKQNRKARKEQRRSNKNSNEMEFVPVFRQIPDDLPETTSETETTLPDSTDFKPIPDQNSDAPLTDVSTSDESFKTIGLEEKQSATDTSTTNLKFNSTETVAPVEQPDNTVPIFPNTSGSDFVTTQNQKKYEDAAAAPQSDDLLLSTEDLEDEVPHLLKKISGIKPFFDYEPDPQIAEKEPCRNLCPRPDGKPCKINENGGETILDCPREFELSREPYQGRNFSESIYTWEASNLNYNPLYFEDPNLERYGLSRKDLVQPFVSMGRFTGQLLALPYKMSIDPIRKKIYPLGYYRPGAYTPKRINGIPWNTKAAITQGLTATGLVFLLP